MKVHRFKKPVDLSDASLKAQFVHASKQFGKQGQGKWYAEYEQRIDDLIIEIRQRGLTVCGVEVPSDAR